MGSIAEAVANVQKSKTCKAGGILQHLDDDDQAALLTLLVRRRFTDVSRIMKGQGFPMDTKAVSFHARGSCACPAGTVLHDVLKGT